jgi:hypothetical protein
VPVVLKQSIIIAVFLAASANYARAETWYIADLDARRCVPLYPTYGQGIATPDDFIALVNAKPSRIVDETTTSGAKAVRILHPHQDLTSNYLSLSQQDCQSEIARIGAANRKWAEGTGMLNPSMNYRFRGE